MFSKFKTKLGTPGHWRFSRGERKGLAVALCVILGFGVNLEQRTALRRTPMTDLGVFACAAGAVRSHDNLYTISDWHGWHYQYPPALAILFAPFAHPVPTIPPSLPPGVLRTASNTPWGYAIDTPGRFYGLHEQNLRFFWIVGAWYLISVFLICFSAHALACALEGAHLRSPPPNTSGERHRWWARRTWPLLVCLVSLGTELSRGQVDVLMLAAIAMGLYLAVTAREFKAGVCLSFPATVKLFPPFLLLYPIWHRRWRMTTGVVAGLVLALVILPVVALGPKRTVELYRLWTEVLAKPALGHGTDTSRAQELTGMTATDNQSLLAFIHNWRYHALPRELRPAEAAPGERYAVYGIGTLMLFGIGLAGGSRRRDTPRELLLISGLLIGLAFVMSPIVHHFYYLVLLPLIVALIDYGLAEGARRRTIFKLRVTLIVFMVIDFLARMPTVGAYLRDLGLPLLSLIAMMVAGVMVLLEQRRGSSTMGASDAIPSAAERPVPPA